MKPAAIFKFIIFTSTSTHSHPLAPTDQVLTETNITLSSNTTSVDNDPPTEVAVTARAADISNRNVPVALWSTFISGAAAEAKNGVSLFGYAAVIPSGVYNRGPNFFPPNIVLKTQLRSIDVPRPTHLTWGMVWDTYRVLLRQREMYELERKPGFVPILIFDVEEGGGSGRKVAAGSVDVDFRREGNDEVEVIGTESTPNATTTFL